MRGCGAEDRAGRGRGEEGAGRREQGRGQWRRTGPGGGRGRTRREGEDGQGGGSVPTLSAMPPEFPPSESSYPVHTALRMGPVALQPSQLTRGWGHSDGQPGTLRLTQPQSGSLEEWPLEAAVGAQGSASTEVQPPPTPSDARPSTVPVLSSQLHPGPRKIRLCPAPQPEAAHCRGWCPSTSSHPQCDHRLSVSLEAQGHPSMRQPGLVTSR